MKGLILVQTASIKLTTDLSSKYGRLEKRYKAVEMVVKSCTPIAQIHSKVDLEALHTYLKKNSPGTAVNLTRYFAKNRNQRILRH